ncbi:MAG: IPTL-CTERM sorting domain-containing protein [Planctomycetota bacterium]
MARAVLLSAALGLSALVALEVEAADVILNEASAVDDDQLLDNLASDPFWGRRTGNGGDWFEVVVVTDHLDMRGWEFFVSNDTGGAGQETFLLKLTTAALWSDIRRGTIITISEDAANNVGDYHPELGQWWINVRASPLTAGTYITVACVAPACAPAAANWKVSNRNWQLTIRNSAGTIHFGPAGEGIQPLSGVGGNEVLKLQVDPSNSITPTSGYTDGSSSTFGLPNVWNAGANTQSFAALRSVVPYSPLSNVRINEVLAHSDPGFDWVELHNTTGVAVNVGKWYLSDDLGNLMQYQIPNGTTIPANGYLVLHQDPNNPPTNPNMLPFGFSSSGGDQVVLSAADVGGALTGGRDAFSFGPTDNGVTIGRTPNGTGRTYRLASATQGSSNAGPRIGPVVINEIMYHPPTILSSGLITLDPEFVELRNISNQPVNLFTDYGPPNGNQPWSLSGGIDFSFSTSTTIAERGYLVVVNFDPVVDTVKDSLFRTKYGLSSGVPIVGPYTGSLNNFSDTVRLRKPDTPEPGFVPAVVVDEVTYVDFGAWPTAADGGGPSLERINSFTVPGDVPSNWAANMFNTASPGTVNLVSPEIPTLSEWSLVAMASLLLAAGTATIRRRKQYS